MFKYHSRSISIAIATKYLLVFLLLTGCEKNITIRKRIFTEDFEQGVAHNITAVSGAGQSYGRIVRPFGGSNVCGMFNNSILSLKVDSLPSHNMIYVAFDFYAHDGWEGNKQSGYGIPDVWNIQVNGRLQISTTFSNVSGSNQAFPEWVGVGSPSPARSNSLDTLLTGFCLFDSKSNGSSKYRISFSRPHTDSILLVQMNDALQGSACQKSWSIDNILIEAITN